MTGTPTPALRRQSIDTNDESLPLKKAERPTGRRTRHPKVMGEIWGGPNTRFRPNAGEERFHVTSQSQNGTSSFPYTDPEGRYDQLLLR